MKKYMFPNITVISFQQEDIVRTSTIQEVEQPEDNAILTDTFID